MRVETSTSIVVTLTSPSKEELIFIFADLCSAREGLKLLYHDMYAYSDLTIASEMTHRVQLPTSKTRQSSVALLLATQKVVDVLYEGILFEYLDEQLGR